MRTFDDTLNYISTIEKARTAQEVCTRLLRFTTDFGLDRMIAGAIPDQRLTQKEQLDHVFFSGWPLDWGQRYFERNYVYHDPVIAGIRRRMEPFVWSEVRAQNEDQLSARIMDEACDFHLREGYAIPFVSLDGILTAVSLGGERAEIPAPARGTISLVTSYAMGRALQIKSEENSRTLPSEIQLTEREAECMKWAAAGKSEWEISVILGISEHTSGKHLQNAKTKLGAANRIHAVAEAIRRGYIT
jgi:LuxR family quorum sensing-dependent transcriptional regulator